MLKILVIATAMPAFFALIGFKIHSNLTRHFNIYKALDFMLKILELPELQVLEALLLRFILVGHCILGQKCHIF